MIARSHRARVVALIAGTLLAASPSGAQLPAPPLRTVADRATLQALIGAEDRRGRTAEDLATLHRGLASANPWLRAYAARGIGRLERADQIPLLAQTLRDSSPLVRAQAAHAVGQAASRGGAAEARNAINTRLREEGDAGAVAALAETLGRLQVTSRDSAISTMARLVSLAAAEMNDTVRLRGVARAFYFLTRQRSAVNVGPVPEVSALLAAMGRPTSGGSRERGGSDDAGAYIRMLATAAQVAIEGATTTVARRALDDPDPMVRREGAVAVLAIADTAVARELALRVMADAAPMVRYRAVGLAARKLSPGERCPALLRMLRDADTTTMIAAIDAVGAAAGPAAVCRGDSTAAGALRGIATIGTPREGWQPAAHALVALTTLDPEGARTRLASFARHSSFFARGYAVTAAQRLRETQWLTTLAMDRHPNVAQAAIGALSEIAGHAADSIYLRALHTQDSQLLMAASGALRGSTVPGVADSLYASLARVTALRAETSRDGRVALMARIGEHGKAADAPVLQRYLNDFDPTVADSAAAILTRWTGTRVAGASRSLPAAALPTVATLERLARQRVMIVMADGSRVELRLLPFDAPTNVARFAALVEGRRLDGLTFHRVVPWFVVQGGSPNANEYSGYPAFTRDELGVENRRGSIGLSTRGRDTGDGQMYANTLHNVRLDHDYTVFAHVVSGMEVFDRLQEGAVIRSVRLAPTAGPR